MRLIRLLFGGQKGEVGKRNTEAIFNTDCFDGY